jgi:hypothetical protein
LLQQGGQEALQEAQGWLRFKKKIYF